MGWRRVLRVPIAGWVPEAEGIPAGCAMHAPRRRGYDWASEVPAPAANRPEHTWLLCCGDDGVVRTGVRRASWLDSRGFVADLERGLAAVERAAAVEVLAPGGPIRSVSLPLPQAGQRFEGPTVVRTAPGERGLRASDAFSVAERDFALRREHLRFADVRRGLPLFLLMATIAVVAAVALRRPPLVLVLLPALLLLSTSVATLRRLRAGGLRPLYDEHDIAERATIAPARLTLVGPESL